MVQEFHVLKCFACETFQVQQVKKAKKWNCKMCGEKQSVIKEYGRGTGADCRRHVQKLNGLRGQLLEEENESAWTRWEEAEECEYSQEDSVLPSEPHQDVGGSRWSKYIKTPVDPDDEEEQEETFYTESKRFSNQRNIRKRKRGRGARRGSGYRDDNVDEEEEENQDVAWKRNKSHAKPLAHTRPAVNPSAQWEDHTFSTPTFHSNSPKPATASKPLPSGVPSRNVPGNQHRPSLYTEPNHSQHTSLSATDRSLGNVSLNRKADNAPHHSVIKVSQPETKSSKWSRFLTSTSNEDQENNGQGDPQWSETGQGLEESLFVGNTNSDSGTGFENWDSLGAKPANTSHSSGLFCPVLGLAGCSGVVEKIKSTTACFGFGSATNQTPSPSFTTQMTGKEKPVVCSQPPPAKRPCPGLATGSLFQTDEDFDDAF